MTVSYFCIMGINLLLLVLFVEKFSMNKYAGQLAALAISVSLSFAAQKYVVFRKKESEPCESRQS
jgi:putative flippase GtrA